MPETTRLGWFFPLALLGKCLWFSLQHCGWNLRPCFMPGKCPAIKPHPSLQSFPLLLVTVSTSFVAVTLHMQASLHSVQRVQDRTADNYVSLQTNMRSYLFSSVSKCYETVSGSVTALVHRHSLLFPCPGLPLCAGQ